MSVIHDLKADTIAKKVAKNCDAESLVKTDNFKRYCRVKDKVRVHQASTVEPKQAGKVLPWVHTMISNAKRNLLGIHHMISKKYYQDYLDEFCYKVNRRYFEEKPFDRFLIACVTYNYKNYIHVNR